MTPNLTAVIIVIVGPIFVGIIIGIVFAAFRKIFSWLSRLKRWFLLKFMGRDCSARIEPKI